MYKAKCPIACTTALPPRTLDSEDVLYQGTLDPLELGRNWVQGDNLESHCSEGLLFQEYVYLYSW